MARRNQWASRRAALSGFLPAEIRRTALTRLQEDRLEDRWEGGSNLPQKAARESDHSPRTGGGDRTRTRIAPNLPSTAAGVTPPQARLHSRCAFDQADGANAVGRGLFDSRREGRAEVQGLSAAAAVPEASVGRLRRRDRAARRGVWRSRRRPGDRRGPTTASCASTCRPRPAGV